MRRPPPLAAVALVLIGLAPPRRALAQGEDAVAVRRGTLRVTLAPDWSRWDRRFGRGTTGFPDGATEPLAVDFSSDSLGTTQLPFLASGETRVRAATGLAGHRFNLGRARLTLNASWRSVPIGLELAVSRRLSIGVAVPLVRARMEVFLAGPDTGLADSATRGNAGLNPVLLTPGFYDAFRTDVDTALRALLFQANNGPAALRPTAQATLTSLQPLLCALYTIAAGNAGGTQSLCFDPAGVGFSSVLPAAGTEAGDSVASRLLQARNAYDQTRAQYAAQGITLPLFTAAYDLPAGPLDATTWQQLIQAPGGPLRGDSLATIVRTRLGDIETGAWYQLADRPRWRSQFSLLVRLPTGHVDSPNNFVDLGTGDHQLDVEVGWRNDLVLNPQLWIHIGGRYGRQFADELDRRIAPVNEVFPVAASLARVRRDLGDYVALDVVPRWQLDDAFSLGIGYHFYRQGAAHYTYANPADSLLVGLTAALLNEETEVRRMRIGAGLTFSTIARHARGRARLPYAVTASFQKTFFGEGGRVPDAATFNLTIRGYMRLWGASER